jgi:hypothetical protein
VDEVFRDGEFLSRLGFWNTTPRTARADAGSVTTSRPITRACAARGGERRREDSKEGGLAAAVGPEHAEQFPRLDVEADAGEGLPRRRTAPGGVDVPQVLEVDGAVVHERNPFQTSAVSSTGKYRTDAKKSRRARRVVRSR